MEVLLEQDVKKLGYRGDVVTVKNGYFRNFLMPRKLASVLTPKLRKLAEERNKTRTLRKEQLLENSKDVLKKLKGLKVTLKEKVSAKGKMFGSVTEEEIVEAVKAAAKVELEKDLIKMKHIKELGEHKVKVHLGEGLEEEIVVNVEALEEEKKEEKAKKSNEKTAKKTAKKSTEKTAKKVASKKTKKA